jgi:hypothetical protein
MAKKSKASPKKLPARFEHLIVHEEQTNSDGSLPDVPELVDECPVLNAFLTCNEFEGKVRKTSTITLWVEEHGIKGVFSDRHGKRKLWAEAESLIAFFQALEARLTADQVDWRSDSGTKWRGRS